MINRNPKPTAFSLFELGIAILMIAVLTMVYIGGTKLVSLSRLAKARALTNSSSVGGVEDLTMWFESTSAKSFATSEAIDGHIVTQWNDINPRLPLAKNVTAAGGNEPTYVANAINGLPAINFNGINQFFSRDNTYGYEFAGTNQITVFIVSKSISPAKSSSVFYWQGTSRLNLHNPWSDGTVYFDFGTCCGSTGRISTTIPAMDKWSITSMIKKPDGNANISVDNSVIATSATMSSTFILGDSATFFLGGFGGADTHRGLIAELIIFERALSDEERLEVTKYLSKKWSIKIS